MRESESPCVNGCASGTPVFGFGKAVTIRRLLEEDAAEGEQSEEQLDNFAGDGFFSWPKKRFWKWVKKGSKK